MAVNDFDGDFDFPQVVEDIFNKLNMHYDIRKSDDTTVFLLPMSAKNAPSLNVKFYIFENDSMQLRSYLANNIEDYQRKAVMSVINDLNNHYRYITLSIDDDGDVAAVYDAFKFVSEDETVITKQVIKMLYTVSEVMDQCIPPIMKTIWSTQKDEEDED